MDYVNLKNEYGEDDVRAVEAKNKFNKADKKLKAARKTKSARKEH